MLSCRILRNKIGSLHHLGTQSHYEVKHATSSSLYNTLYPAAAAAYTAAAAAYQSMTPQAAIQQVSQGTQPSLAPGSMSSAGGGKMAGTPSPPVSGATCGMRPPWPSSHTVSDLLGHVNMAGLPRHHHMQDANNYNYYMYLQSCGPQSNALPHAPLGPNPLSSPLANGFSNPLANTLPAAALPNGLQNGFTNPLTSMVGASAALTPQAATL